MSDGTAVALQKAIVGRLRGSAGVTALVPAADIFDRSTRPERTVCIIVGDDQMVREPLTYEDCHLRVYVTLHLWHKAQDFALVKSLGDAVRKAMRARFVVPGIYVVYCSFEASRYLRDPAGDYVHGVVTFNFLVQEPQEVE